MSLRYKKFNSGFTPDEESFYLTVTSDNNSDIFPDNKVSDFQARLSNSIFLDHNSWKVGLASYQYPYEFANVTDNSWVRFYCQGSIKTLQFPAWFCETIEDLCTFLSQIITHHLKGILKDKSHELEKPNHSVVYDTNPSEWLDKHKIDFQNQYNSYSVPPTSTENAEKVEEEEEKWFIPKVSEASFTIEVTTLRRIKMKSNLLDFDICFSENLLEMLGLAHLDRFTAEHFNYRTKTKDSIMRIVSLITKWNQKTTYDTMHRILYRIKKKPWFSISRTISYAKIHLGLRGFEPLQSALLWYDAPVADLFIAPEEPGANKHNTWYNVSEFWCNYINEDEYQGIYDMDRLSLEADMNPSYSANLAELLTVTILRKVARQQLFGATYHSDTASKVIPYEIMFIYTDLVKPEPFNSVMSRLLAVIKTEGSPGKMSTFNPTTVQYKSLEKIDISNFKVLIASDKGEPIPFIRGPTILTLHFVRS